MPTSAHVCFINANVDVGGGWEGSEVGSELQLAVAGDAEGVMSAVISMAVTAEEG